MNVDPLQGCQESPKVTHRRLIRRFRIRTSYQRNLIGDLRFPNLMPSP